MKEGLKDAFREGLAAVEEMTHRRGGNRDAVSWRLLGVGEPPPRGRQHYEFPGKS